MARMRFETLMVMLVGVVGALIIWQLPFEDVLEPLQVWVRQTIVRFTPQESTNSELLVNARVQALQEELDQLKKIAGVSLPSAHIIRTNVLGFEPYHTTHVILGAGEQGGIYRGAAVISQDGALVGVVASAHENTAVVRLLTDQAFKIAGVVAGSASKVNGVVTGVHATGVQFSLIPLTEALKKGDTVLTAGDELGIPRGIPVGTIEDLTSMQGVALQEAVIQPLVSFRNLMYVGVVAPEL